MTKTDKRLRRLKNELAEASGPNMEVMKYIIKAQIDQLEHEIGIIIDYARRYEGENDGAGAGYRRLWYLVNTGSQSSVSQMMCRDVITMLREGEGGHNLADQAKRRRRA